MRVTRTHAAAGLVVAGNVQHGMPSPFDNGVG
jgi:hypothetical protein